MLVDLLARARSAPDRHAAPLPPAAWIEALAASDPDARARFDAAIVRGAPTVLPDGALGPCFRPGVGAYVAFDAGFDVESTRRAEDHVIVALRRDGPAARAGLADGDVVEAIDVTDGDATRPATVTLVRGGVRREVTYLPRGRTGRGQTWTRETSLPDARCGLPP